MPFYFDNHATTAVDPRVLAQMLPTFSETYGNPDSAHAYGWRTQLLVEKARGLTAALLGAQANEIHFTSGATESINRAILGTLETLAPEGQRLHVITGATEHKATLEACAEAESRGHDITILPVDHEGLIQSDDVLAALKPNTVLVSLMHGNNEIGTLHPIAQIGHALRARKPEVLLHVDAAQTAGKHEIDVEKMAIDLLSLSAHKFHGPKGVGALYLRSTEGRRVHVHSLHQGTANVSGIVGLGAACEIAKLELAHDHDRVRCLRDQILETVEERLGAFGTNGLRLNGARRERLCNNISLTFEGVEPDQLMLALKDIAYSSASACTGPLQSHVLRAIGLPNDNPFLTTVRFGLSRLTTDEEVAVLIERLIESVRTTREISQAYDRQVKPILKTPGK